MDMLFTHGTFEPWIAAALALLIGVLFGAERETSGTKVHVGLRDFVVVSAIAHVLARINEPWLTVGVSTALGLLMVVHHSRQDATVGITTEVALSATFVLAYVVSSAYDPALRQLAVALAVILTLLLDAKPNVKRFFRQTITEVELADTLKFLALVFVIFPLLPDGRYGPYDAIAPRSLWIAVLLVSGISYVGYFFEKFLGAPSGLRIVAVFGGLVSTTAATQAFAQRASQDAERTAEFVHAATIANAVQFLRVLALLAVVQPAIAWKLTLPLSVAALVGLGIGFVRTPAASYARSPLGVGNPLRLRPALLFALYLALITLASRWAIDAFGGGALLWTSALAGLVDVDAVTLSAADHWTSSTIEQTIAAWAVVIALGSNILSKSVVARTSGTPAFARSVAGSMALMLTACAVTLLLIG